MSRHSAILLVVTGLVASLLFLGVVWSPLGETASEDTPENHGEAVQHAFLKDLDLDEPNADYALVFYDLATGNGTRAVLDENVIRAAQDNAFFTDNPSETGALQIELSSHESLSDALPDGAFVSVIRNRAIEKTYTCQADFCSAPQSLASSAQRDIAGLLDAALPVELITLEFRHHEQARAAHWRLLNQDTTIFVYPPKLPSPDTIVYPNRMILDLPPVLLATDETTKPRTPFDPKDYMARFSAAFGYAFPDTEAYRLNELSWRTHAPPEDGWPIISSELDGPLRDDAGNLRGVHGYMVIEPSVAIDLIPDLANTLSGVEPFVDMPEFARDPVSIAATLDEIAAETLGWPCSGCFKIALPASKPDAIKVTPVAPIPFTVSYFRLVQDEPTAQQ